MADITMCKIGEKYVTNEGYEVEIIEYFNNRNIKIKLNDGNVIKNLQYGNIIRGNVKNPYHKSVYGVGFIGVGEYSSKTHPKIYQTWNRMLERCYDLKYQEIKSSYTGCSVTEEWHNYQNFAEWFEKNYVEGFVLDKDILVKGNRVYSHSTCGIVPHEINEIFIKRQNDRGEHPIGVTKLGNKFITQISLNIKRQKYLGSFNTPEEAFQVYKEAKEVYIKVVADKWREQITEQIYQAMYNYQVEITD